MSLDNLLKTKQLQLHNPSKETVRRLLESAKRNLSDAHVAAVSGENRFDRTSTSQPGHHQTALQTLPTTIGLPASTVIILDGLRKQRNVSDYEGDPISDQAVVECIRQAMQLYQDVLEWISTHRAELF
jgi:hypothetical protein